MSKTDISKYCPTLKKFNGTLNTSADYATIKGVGSSPVKKVILIRSVSGGDLSTGAQDMYFKCENGKVYANNTITSEDINDWYVFTGKNKYGILIEDVFKKTLSDGTIYTFKCHQIVLNIGDTIINIEKIIDNAKTNYYDIKSLITNFDVSAFSSASTAVINTNTNTSAILGPEIDNNNLFLTSSVSMGSYNLYNGKYSISVNGFQTYYSFYPVDYNFYYFFDNAGSLYNFGTLSLFEYINGGWNKYGDKLIAKNTNYIIKCPSGGGRVTIYQFDNNGDLSETINYDIIS